MLLVHAQPNSTSYLDISNTVKLGDEDERYFKNC